MTYTKLIQEIPLKWGATLLVAKFPANGTVSFVGSVLGGVRSAPNAQFARVHAAMLLEGTAHRSKKDIQHFLDDIGATLTFSVTSNRLLFSGRVRTSHVEKLMGLVVEMLSEPLFAPTELEILKKRELASLALAAQDTHAQADIALSRTLFLPGHPNYMETTDESREALLTVSPDILRSYHERVIGKDGLILSFAGDITSSIATRATTLFATLLSKGQCVAPVTPATIRRPTSIKIPIEHKASIDVMFGIATGITLSHKDYPALMLGMQILGNPGGFTGRLMSTVREQEGLTYGVYAYISGYTKITDGYLNIWATFAPQLYAQGKDAIVREIKKMYSRGVTQEEVTKHRKLYVARTRVRLANSGALARAAHEVVSQGFHVDRLDTFPKRVLRLTQKDVTAVIKKYLKPHLLCQSAAGPLEQEEHKG